MRRSLPPLNALRSFDAAARHQSFTRAAEELCVTQGAVSHQVKALEVELGLQLFKRERNGLIITDAGRDYLAVVRDAFERLSLAPTGCCNASGRARSRSARHRILPPNGSSAAWDGSPKCTPRSSSNWRP